MGSSLNDIEQDLGQWDQNAKPASWTRDAHALRSRSQALQERHGDQPFKVNRCPSSPWGVRA
jgi:hypothetical protein